MGICAALAAAIVAASPAPAPARDAAPRANLALATPGSMSLPSPLLADAGPFHGRELAGSGLGVLAGDALVLGLAWGTYQLFTSGAVAPTAANFRRAAYGLLAATLLVPPLGATVGGSLLRQGPAFGHPWKSFILSIAGHAAALAAAYLAAPHYWAALPVQLLTMTAGTSVGLHWGRGPRGDAPPRRDAPPADDTSKDEPPVALRAPVCPVPVAG
jgi:hypothetical protein